MIEENEEDSKEESGIKSGDDDLNLNPFEELDDFVGITKQKPIDFESKPKLFDMGDDIHNLCDTPEPKFEKDEIENDIKEANIIPVKETANILKKSVEIKKEKDALADVPIRSQFDRLSVESTKMKNTSIESAKMKNTSVESIKPKKRMSIEITEII